MKRILEKVYDNLDFGRDKSWKPGDFERIDSIDVEALKKPKA